MVVKLEEGKYFNTINNQPVSVPLRGNGRETRLRSSPLSLHRLIMEFPSPCGVMVVKHGTIEISVTKATRGFPSPCGVMVVKLSIVQVQKRVDLYIVSVPLRGNGRETSVD